MIHASKRAIATAVFLIAIILASIAIYDINAQSVHQEVIVRKVDGHLYSNGAPVALGFSYPSASNGLIFFKDGGSFYVFLYLSGDGVIQNVSVTTPGFDGTIIAPLLPLSIDNYTEPAVIILQVFATSCCFNGTVDFNVNATT